MRVFSITSYIDNTILYEGQFSSMKACLEQAVSENTPLRHANLTKLNLANANLDDAALEHAGFKGSNLTGANLSEARLLGSNFTNTSLYNTCLAYSNLQNCDFRHVSFGATDITGSTINNNLFTLGSCPHLDLMHVESMENCIFEHAEDQHRLSYPPMVLQGVTNTPIILLDTLMIIGDQTLPFAKCKNLGFINMIASQFADQKFA